MSPVDIIEMQAMQQALAKLAERCVHAEARATVAEAEVTALKRNVEQLKEQISYDDLEKRRWWLVFWLKQGVKPAALVKYRVNVCREAPEEAKRLVYSGRWSYESPDPNVTGSQYFDVKLPERETIE